MGGWDQGIEALFEDTQEAFPLWSRVNNGVLLYRTKTITSGSMLEVCAYPIIKQDHRTRGPRRTPSSKAQAKVNARERKQRLIRKAEANFGRGSVFVTLTYAEDPGEDQAHKDLTGYLRRLKYRCKALKYIAVTEVGHNGRVHHHLLLDGADRDTAERLWQSGFVNSRKYQENRGGMSGLVRYMLKKTSTLDPGEEGIGKKRIRCSKGLKDPIVRISDHRLSRRRLQAIAEESDKACAATLEKIFDGYQVAEPVRITASWYLPGAYLYACLRKKVKDECPNGGARARAELLKRIE